MEKHVIQYELLIGLIFIALMMTMNQDDLFMMIVALLVYAILKAAWYIIRLFRPNSIIVTVVIILYLLVLQYYLVAMGMFLTLNIMLIGQLDRRIRYVACCLYLGFILLSGVDMSSLVVSVGLFSVLGIALLQDFVEKESSKKERIQTLSEQIDRMKTHTLLNQRQEDEISTISRLEERNAIAQQLHDKLGHVLSGNIIQLEATGMLMEKDPDKARQRIQLVIGNLRKGMDDIRVLLKSMKPESASMNVERIKSMITETEKISDIKMKFIYDDIVNELNHKTWKVIITNIQECLTNMMKYSSATRCQIEIGKLNRHLRVLIKDNGKGCRNVKKGMGLTGMEERLSLIGGKLIVDGTDGFSTVMLIQLEETDE